MQSWVQSNPSGLFTTAQPAEILAGWSCCCLFACFPSVLVQEDDHRTRVNEAVAKAVVLALKGTTSDDNTDPWLNPTEVLRSSLFAHHSLGWSASVVS